MLQLLPATDLRLRLAGLNRACWHHRSAARGHQPNARRSAAGRPRPTGRSPSAGSGTRSDASANSRCDGYAAGPGDAAARSADTGPRTARSGIRACSSTRARANACPGASACTCTCTCTCTCAEACCGGSLRSGSSRTCPCSAQARRPSCSGACSCSGGTEAERRPVCSSQTGCAVGSQSGRR
jgi:hypothetical protein